MINLSASRPRYIIKLFLWLLLSISTLYGLITVIYINDDSIWSYSFELIATLSSCVVGLALVAFGFTFLGLFDTKISYNKIILFQEESEFNKIPPTGYFSLKRNVDVNINSNNQNLNKIRCFYKCKYYDLKKSQLVEFQCQEEATNTGYCIFHRGGLFEDDVTANTINERINMLVENKQEVFCIGYNMPFISLSGKKIYKPLYFHDTKIKIADFRDVNFVSDEAILYLINSSFEGAYFENAEFHGQVLFVDACFKQKDDYFSNLNYYNSDVIGKYRGYASFSNAKFYRKANFHGASFFGIARFDDAIFFDDADFEHSKFHIEKHKELWKYTSFHGRTFLRHMNIKDNRIKESSG
jgi:uncharacterized protein YjbI with pentapeptide repeats